MKLKLTDLLHHVVGLAIMLLFILPLYWVLVASLREPGLPPPKTIQWWVSPAHWGNYIEIFNVVPMARYTINSLLVVAAAVPITLVTASLAAYGMIQQPEALRRRLLMISIALLIIPAPSVWLFRFQIFSWLGLLNTLWSLIVPAFAASSPLFVLLFYWSFRRIPPEIFEAARLEGANALLIWWRIALPLARSTSVGVIVLTFVMYWSDFINPVLYLYRPESYTLPVGLQILKQLDATNWSLLMAGAAFMTAPIVVLFVFLQRYFLSDMSLGQLFERN